MYRIFCVFCNISVYILSTEYSVYSILFLCIFSIQNILCILYIFFIQNILCIQYYICIYSLYRIICVFCNISVHILYTEYTEINILLNKIGLNLSGLMITRFQEEHIDESFIPFLTFCSLLRKY